jgi:hypothetical protein
MSLVCFRFDRMPAGHLPLLLSTAVVQQEGEEKYRVVRGTFPNDALAWVAVQDWAVPPEQTKLACILGKAPTLPNPELPILALGTWSFVNGKADKCVWASAHCGPEVIQFTQDSLFESMLEQMNQAQEHVQQF